MSIRQLLFGYVSLDVLYLAIGVIFGGNGCNGQELEKRFTYTMEDSSHGVIIIEYKPNSLMKENKKLGSHYYIVKHFPSAEAISKAMADISSETSLPTNEQEIEEGVRNPEKLLEKYAQAISKKNISYDMAVAELPPEDQPYFKRVYTEFRQLETGVVKIAFYDRTGHSLLRIGNRTTLAPDGWSNTYEANRIENGYEWKGQFGESWLTFENFCDIDSVKVEYVR